MKAVICCFALTPTQSLFFALSLLISLIFFFSSRRRHTRCSRDWSSDVCSSDLVRTLHPAGRLDFERVGGAHVPIGRDLVAQALDEGALRRRERIGHNEQIRPDTKIGRASCRERLYGDVAPRGRSRRVFVLHRWR